MVLSVMERARLIIRNSGLEETELLPGAPNWGQKSGRQRERESVCRLMVHWTIGLDRFLWEEVASLAEILQVESLEQEVDIGVNQQVRIDRGIAPVVVHHELRRLRVGRSESCFSPSIVQFVVAAR